eukprot:281209_1
MSEKLSPQHMALQLLLCILTYFMHVSHTSCRCILANGTPWISLDVCFHRYEQDTYRSITASCAKDGTAVHTKVYNGTDCMGAVIEETTQDYDASQLICQGTICNHALIRNYDDNNCDRSGDYTEFPFPVHECFTLRHHNGYIGSLQFKCNGSGVFTQIHPIKSDVCVSSKVVKEVLAWDEYGECNDKYQWSQFIECADDGSRLISVLYLYFMLSIIVTFLY